MNAERKNDASRTAAGMWLLVGFAAAGGGWFVWDTMSQRQALERAGNVRAAASLVQRMVGPKCEAAYPELRPAIVYAEHNACCNVAMSLCRRIPAN